jgi:tetratricopeptide (TPR) repeat protein
MSQSEVSRRLGGTRRAMSSSPADAPQSKPAAEGVLERGQSIDRFVVIGLVGRGGMGEVYAAYDPELDRKVAIKLLRARGQSAEGRTRLLREAQAIAKLSHPNVVVVYDVGTFGDSVFIAMEFVEGRTLGGWMHAANRSRREVMQVFLAAGRGLAAAHAAGLVHRDFKPDNVMVTNDGQVRVMDFGLARQAGAADDKTDSMPPPVANLEEIDPDATANLGPAGSRSIAQPTSPSSGSYLALKLTQTGAMVGTPAYMAPEQFAMAATDPRTDQFSFCVALYEMLYGQRPFEGDTFLALMTSVTSGTPREAPAKAKVPGWMRKILLRGLATDPDRRYPSMNALLTALETDPTVRWRRTGTGVVLAAALALAGVAARRASTTKNALCRGGGDRWAGVWDAEGASSARKDAIHKAFAATGRSYAESAFKNVSGALDTYVGKWVAMYTDACEATQVRGEQSAEVLDLRMTCLQERVTNAAALSEVFAHADGTVVENAVSAAGGLASLDQCADVPSLRAVVKPPANAQLRKRVEDLRGEQARFVALSLAGHCAEAETLAQALIPRVREAGYAPLLGKTLLSTWRLPDACGDPRVGVERLEEGYTAAISARDDDTAAEAAIHLTSEYADRVRDTVRGRQWLNIATATLRRYENHPLLDAWLLTVGGTLLEREGRLDEAMANQRKAILAKEKLVGPDNADIAMSFNNLGNSLVSAHRDAEAVEPLSQAIARLERSVGADNPFVALVSNNLGEALNGLHRHAEARAAFGRSLEIWRRTGGDAFLVSYGLTGQGIAMLGEGHAADAVAPLEEALRIRIEKKSAPDQLGETRFALARALWSKPAARERARTLAHQARTDYAQLKTAATTVASIDAWLAAPAAKL